jgi:hypothetical protein
MKPGTKSNREFRNNLQKGDLDHWVTLLTEARPAGVKPKVLLLEAYVGVLHIPLRESPLLENPTEKGPQMSSLQRRITAVIDTTANLITQLRELDRLREQVRKAEEFSHLAEQELRDADMLQVRSTRCRNI